MEQTYLLLLTFSARNNLNVTKDGGVVRPGVRTVRLQLHDDHMKSILSACVTRALLSSGEFKWKSALKRKPPTCHLMWSAVVRITLSHRAGILEILSGTNHCVMPWRNYLWIPKLSFRWKFQVIFFFFNASKQTFSSVNRTLCPTKKMFHFQHSSFLSQESPYFLIFIAITTTYS